MTSIFEPVEVGGRTLANRVVMAPMTRNRAVGPGNTPTESMATYYAQRAGAGLIVTEGTQPSAVGQGYPFTPGLHSDEQVQAWRAVTDAVHARGGVIFAQIMHAGRISHPTLLPDVLHPVGPSPVAAAGQVFTGDGMKDFVEPIALDEHGLAETKAAFVDAARNAIAAGFDGVEVHGANGYLLHQFLSTNANQRTDAYGGSVEGRTRFPVEVTAAIADAIGAQNTGLRISPANPFNDIVEDGYRDTYTALVDAVAPLGLAYLHLAETVDRDLTVDLRKRFGGTFVLNPATPGGFTGPEHAALVEEGVADLVSFGQLYLANPDLPERLRAGGPFNPADKATFYGGTDTGYIDYPTL
ncbi:alkene reductase [Actinokineospora bangkokensis]|uniref:Alkene reductase n=1 Tax=Actinokineospora bangkokensis TaxID=1193682 RepID=A0A1Q9LRC2_9PSEU|nr:alkene reductase [Actinokineospora bangkokensis]OLR94570.1 alkene reductase [Actinokineospora bangkokensis]